MPGKWVKLYMPIEINVHDEPVNQPRSAKSLYLFRQDVQRIANGLKNRCDLFSIFFEMIPIIR